MKTFVIIYLSAPLRPDLKSSVDDDLWHYLYLLPDYFFKVQKCLDFSLVNFSFEITPEDRCAFRTTRHH